jgi:hypothetical protein
MPQDSVLEVGRLLRIGQSVGSLTKEWHGHPNPPERNVLQFARESDAQHFCTDSYHALVLVRPRPAVGVRAAALRELGPEGEAEAAVLESRRLGARGDHAGAVSVLEAAAKGFPRSVGVRVALSPARLAQGAPPEALEAAFRGVLELDPANAQAKHNLEVLMRNTGRFVEGVIDPPPGGRHG